MRDGIRDGTSKGLPSKATADLSSVARRTKSNKSWAHIGTRPLTHRDHGVGFIQATQALFLSLKTYQAEAHQRRSNVNRRASAELGSHFLRGYRLIKGGAFNQRRLAFAAQFLNTSAGKHTHTQIASKIKMACV